MARIIVRINETDHMLRAEIGHYITRVAESKDGGYICVEVMAVHTHECIRRRWGRKNHDKPCNCGADALWMGMESEPAKGEESRCQSNQREDGSHYCADCDGYFHAPTEAR